MHIVAHEGQVLKTRTVTRLVRDQQFNSVEFKKIVLPPHVLQNLTIKNLKKIELFFRNYSGHSSCSSSQR